MSLTGKAARLKKAWKEHLDRGGVLTCGICKEPIKRHNLRISKGGKGNLTVDHIVPKALGGKDHPSNLQPAHNKCNGEKGHSVL